MTTAPADRSLTADARDLWRSFVIAINLSRRSRHAKVLRFRWGAMICGLAAFMDASEAFRPLAFGHLLQAGLGLLALGLAMAWNPGARQPWWQDPDARDERSPTPW